MISHSSRFGMQHESIPGERGQFFEFLCSFEIATDVDASSSSKGGREREREGENLIRVRSVGKIRHRQRVPSTRTYKPRLHGNNIGNPFVPLPLRISPLYARSFDGHGFPPVPNKGYEPLSGKAKTLGQDRKDRGNELDGWKGNVDPNEDF